MGPRLIPVPESPRHGEELELPPLENDVNDPSASFDKQCAPSQAPILDEGPVGAGGGVNYYPPIWKNHVFFLKKSTFPAPGGRC